MTATVEQLILDLADHNLREKALLDLSKKRDNVPNLALLLWNSFGTIAILIQELVSIYPYLSPPTLTSAASNRVCNALALLQCVASHDGTRHLLLNAQIPLYLYPFLNPKSQAKQFEYLRLTSMGVIGALVKVDDPAIINFLLHTQIIPLCLQTMEVGGELSKTVATFIVQKILMDDGGLRYICDTQERFFAVASVLGSLARSHRDENHARRRLLKHIVRCFRRLADNERAREALRNLIPQLLQHPNLSNYLSEDQEIGLLFEDLMRYLLRGS